jgi:hypothetical protein
MQSPLVTAIHAATVAFLLVTEAEVVVVVDMLVVEVVVMFTVMFTAVAASSLSLGADVRLKC